MPTGGAGGFGVFLESIPKSNLSYGRVARKTPFPPIHLSPDSDFLRNIILMLTEDWLNIFTG